MADSSRQEDIDRLPEAETIKSDYSRGTFVDFEIAFYTLILTIVLAYPEDSTVYQSLKILLIGLALLTIIRRAVVMTTYYTDGTGFMTWSKELMTEISALGFIYALMKISEIVSTTFQYIGPTQAWFALTIGAAMTPMALRIKFARQDVRYYQTILATQEANRHPISYWRRINRNRAIRSARKLELPEEDVPESVKKLREMKDRRVIPYLGETAQLIHGLFLGMTRRSFGVLFGWLIFGNLLTSLLLFGVTTLLASQVFMLYRRYGLEEMDERPSRFTRRLIQNAGVIFAHFIVLG
ncbi:hypothetical protein G9C85_00210 [Halorubellus sp. JP-L1]|uniref:hypothetical protein n=1 Tax=Halorubellus sp. JP-L1 TaxID=2715753 RepID=UPI0014081133|nr:hypothetical protein [Halorubellus sp. JP-L1]NHN40061.1 hypothetical protein [Halorubellus sp. JP-L1]